MSSLIVPIVKIESLEKHPNADTLLIAKFEGYGWQSLVKVDQYEVGDLVIFVPPDAILPQWIIDLEKIDYLKGSAGKVGSIKLRGVISHGLLLPMNVLEDIETYPSDFRIGENVASELNIIKWEAPEPVYLTRGEYKEKVAKKKNPTFPEYTKIEKIEFFEGTIKDGEKVRITEKIHGTNTRIGWATKQPTTLLDKIKKLFGKYDYWYFTCGTHHVELKLDKPKKSFYNKVVEWNVYQKLANQLKSRIPKGYIIYGEIYGKGIQDLTYGLKGTDYVIFDVMKDGKYLDRNELYSFLIKVGLYDKFVPILFEGEFSQKIVEQLTSGYSVLAHNNGVKQIREGVVIVPLVERFDPVLGRVVVKSINPDYSTRKNGTEYQ